LKIRVLNIKNGEHSDKFDHCIPPIMYSTPAELRYKVVDNSLIAILPETKSIVVLEKNFPFTKHSITVFTEGGHKAEA